MIHAGVYWIVLATRFVFFHGSKLTHHSSTIKKHYVIFK